MVGRRGRDEVEREVGRGSECANRSWDQLDEDRHCLTRFEFSRAGRWAGWSFKACWRKRCRYLTNIFNLFGCNNGHQNFI